MKEIVLKSKKYGTLTVLVDDEDYDYLNQFKWHNDGKGYARRHNGKDKRPRCLFMHREILGLTDPKIFVDHINRITSDNRRENLRVCSHAQNKQNVPALKVKKTSIYKGVSWCERVGKWRACINCKDIGYYNYEINAANAYNIQAIKMHGEFACLNDIDNSLISDEFKKEKSSKYKGVCSVKDKYKSYVYVDKKCVWIDYHSTEIEAITARNKYIIENGLDLTKYKVQEIINC